MAQSPGYPVACANAAPSATRVLDAFHVVALAVRVVDEVRRRVQQDTTGHRGHKDDPLYRVRRLGGPARVAAFWC